MKKLFTIFSLLSILTFSACYTGDEGPEGPIGPRGNDGPQGPAGADGESGFVFEYDNINFTSPAYEVILDYPNDFESFNSDVALVYFLWDVEVVDGEEFEVWRQLPQSIITENGLIQYNFDFTTLGIKLFLDAEVSLDQLTAIDTDNWIARVVVVPGEFWNTNGRIDYSDYSDYSAVKELLGLPELNDLPRAETLKRRVN